MLKSRKNMNIKVDQSSQIWESFSKELIDIDDGNGHVIMITSPFAKLERLNVVDIKVKIIGDFLKNFFS